MISLLGIIGGLLSKYKPWPEDDDLKPGLYLLPSNENFEVIVKSSSDGMCQAEIRPRKDKPDESTTVR